MEFTAESKQSQNDCQVRRSPENIGMLSFGRQLVEGLAMLAIATDVGLVWLVACRVESLVLLTTGKECVEGVLLSME